MYKSFSGVNFFNQHHCKFVLFPLPVCNIRNFQFTHCTKLFSVSDHSVYKLCARNSRTRTGLHNNAVRPTSSGVRKIFTQNVFCSAKFDVSTNVVKDVLLYKYDRQKYFRALNLFGISQYLFWNFLAHTAYTTLRDVPVDDKNVDAPWWKKINLGEQKYRVGITILFVVLGHGLLASTWLYTIKSIRYLVLRKGGDSVSIVTYTPTGHTRTITTKLNKVSCSRSRSNSRVHLPVRVKDYSLYFMLDMEGEFLNPQLFDRTVGMRRVLV